MASADLETEKKKLKKGSAQPTKTAAETGKGLLGTGGNALSAMRKLSMPTPLRSRMEDSFHADLSGLHLYENPSVGRHGFEAVAQGGTIGFAPGRFRPETDAGRSVIGHEIAHVVSQARGESAGAGGRLLRSGMLERRADAEGGRAAAGLSVGGGTVRVGGGNSANAPAQGIITTSDKQHALNFVPHIREGVWRRGLDNMFLLRASLVDKAEEASGITSPGTHGNKSKRDAVKGKIDKGADIADPGTSLVGSTSGFMESAGRTGKDLKSVKGIGSGLGILGGAVGIGTDIYDLYRDPSWQGVVGLINDTGKFLLSGASFGKDIASYAIKGFVDSPWFKMIPGLQSLTGLVDVAVGVGTMVEQGMAVKHAMDFVKSMKGAAQKASIDLENPKSAIGTTLLGLRYDADETAAIAGRMRTALFLSSKKFQFSPNSDAEVETKYRDLKAALSASGETLGTSEKARTQASEASQNASGALTSSTQERTAYKAKQKQIADTQKTVDARRKSLSDARGSLRLRENEHAGAERRKTRLASAFLAAGIDLDAVPKDKRQEFDPMRKLGQVYESRKAAAKAKIEAQNASSSSGTIGAAIRGGMPLPEEQADTSFAALMPEFKSVESFFKESSANGDVWALYDKYDAAKAALDQAKAAVASAQKSLAAQEEILAQITSESQIMPHKSDTEHQVLADEKDAKDTALKSAEDERSKASAAHAKTKEEFESFTSLFAQGYPRGISDSNAGKMVTTKNEAETAAGEKRKAYDETMQKAPAAMEKIASSIRMGDLMKKKAGQEMFLAGFDTVKGVLDIASGVLDATGVAAWIGATIGVISAGLSVAKMITERVQKHMRLDMNLTQTMAARKKYLTAALSSASEAVDGTGLTDDQKKAEKEKLQQNAGFSHLGKFSGRSDDLTKIDEMIQDIIDEAYTVYYADEIQQARAAHKSEAEIAKIAHVTRKRKSKHGTDTTRLFKRLICYEMGSPKGQRAELSDITIYRNAADLLIEAGVEAKKTDVQRWRDGMKDKTNRTALSQTPPDMPALQMLVGIGVMKNLWDALPKLKDMGDKMAAERKDYRNLVRKDVAGVFPELAKWRTDVAKKTRTTEEKETDEDVAAQKDRFLSGFGKDAYAQQHLRGLGARRLAGDMFRARNAAV